MVVSEHRSGAARLPDLFVGTVSDHTLRIGGAGDQPEGSLWPKYHGFILTMKIRVSFHKDVERSKKHRAFTL